MLCVSSSCFLFLHFILFIYLFILVLNFQVCIKSVLVFLFFNRTKRGKCAINTTKIYTPAPSFEKMFLLFAARQTLRNMRFDWAAYVSQSNWSNHTSWKREWVFPGVADEVFFLCRLLRLIRRGQRRHRLCIIGQVRFVGLTFFRNAAFEERTLRHFEHK